MKVARNAKGTYTNECVSRFAFFEVAVLNHLIYPVTPLACTGPGCGIGESGTGKISKIQLSLRLLRAGSDRTADQALQLRVQLVGFCQERGEWRFWLRFQWKQGSLSRPSRPELKGAANGTRTDCRATKGPRWDSCYGFS